MTGRVVLATLAHQHRKPHSFSLSTTSDRCSHVLSLQDTISLTQRLVLVSMSEKTTRMQYRFLLLFLTFAFILMSCRPPQKESRYEETDNRKVTLRDLSTSAVALTFDRMELLYDTMSHDSLSGEANTTYLGSPLRSIIITGGRLSESTSNDIRIEASDSTSHYIEEIQRPPPTVSRFNLIVAGSLIVLLLLFILKTKGRT